MRRLALSAVPLVLLAAGCGSSSTSAAHDAAPSAVTSAATDVPSATDAAAPEPTGSAAGFAALMTSLGFFPGTPASLVDIDGNAVCGMLQSQSMTAVIKYEESVDENATTGMASNKDIVTYVTDAVEAFCPKYASALPAKG